VKEKKEKYVEPCLARRSTFTPLVFSVDGLRGAKASAFEVHMDCDFVENWVKEDAMEDPSTAKSQTGYVITYGGCPIIWASKLQTKVVLSSTESEYVGLSESLRLTTVMMNLLNELKHPNHQDHPGRLLQTIRG
jgi:hypothetical protein